MAKLTLDDTRKASETIEHFINEYTESISEELKLTKEESSRREFLDRYTRLSDARRSLEVLNHHLKAINQK